MATKAQQRKFFNSADEHQKAIVKIIQELSRSQGIDRTWSDWVEMGALAMANAVDKAQFEKREERYMQIISNYKKDEVQQLAEAFAHLVQCWDKRVAVGDFGDALGSTFMMLDMGNAGTGQFFTPYEVSRVMGGIVMGDSEALAKTVTDRGFVRLLEPACGTGGMIIAAAHAMHEAKINYQEAMHVTAIDVDRRCVHMTYLQLAMLHVPAIVIHGNALSLEEWEHWYTPAHVLGGWNARLRQREVSDAMRKLVEAPAAEGQAHIDHAAADAPAHDVEEPLYELRKAVCHAAAAGQMTLF
ncbi:N-6 DNA methylase [Achromobacter kerstersii]|uniref:N-6 DNA methylase n=1 Tax=Achromobacter kerstersii TaxID=1353890 RepID=UPI0006C6A8A0|nr:N-6 DNA methylase [Achromobacter kerstersii]CUJ49402.1 Type I restriction-modification system methyltransferase subunit [Achromobacter kerstersii]